MAGLGSLIRERRRAAGMTQDELSEAAGVSLGVLRDLEQDRTSRPRPDSARRLAAVLGLQIPGLGVPGAPPEEPASHVGTAARFQVLGPMEAWLGSDPVEVGAPKQRATLGLLALHPNAVVHPDRIVDALWGDAPPSSARTMIQAYVSRLRRLLDPGRPGRAPGGVLESAAAGYRLRADRATMDLIAFDGLVGDARGKRAAGDLPGACVLFDKALSLWRGEALADVDALRGHSAVTALARRQADAVEEFAEVAAVAMLHERALPHLRALAAREPLNERAHAQLMIALAATGQQAGALEVHRELRERLTGQLGIDPGSEVAAAHAQVLRGEAGRPSSRGRDAAAPAGKPVTMPVAPRQLPGAARHFVGRSRELAELTRMLDAAAAEPGATGQVGTIVISAIGGTAGVGKTALAVRWAHQIAGRFPDGQLYANLRGFDPAGPPTTPSEVVLGFLIALGVPPERAPADLDARAALYRSLLAGRRVLVLLDNARDSAQVRPLLPGSSGCLVVVTSRAELTGLMAGEGAHLLALDVLSDLEARELLNAFLGRSRAAGDPAAVAELAVLCARLPLALRVVAARAATRPELPPASLAAELRDTASRLSVLSAGEAGTNVRTVFSWSYRQLGAAAARMFRLLGIASGADISLPAAASLAGVPLGQAARALTELTAAHLVTEHRTSRYTCHDLMRAYAAELADSEEPTAERAAATNRLLSWYLHSADAADQRLPSPHRVPLSPPPPRCQPLGFADDQHAVAWFESEYANLGAATTLAGRADSDEIAAMLPVVMSYFAQLRRPLADWMGWAHAGIEAARRAGDAHTEAVLLNRIGTGHHRLGRYEDAVVSYEAALRIRRQTGDRRGEGATLSNLGVCYGDGKGQFERALDCFQQALEISREAADRYSVCIALGNIAEMHCMLEEPTRALAYHEQSLAIARETGNRSLEGRMLFALAATYRKLGRPVDARECYRQALGICQGAGDRYVESRTLSELGDLLGETGQLTAARECWHDALAILEDLHHPDADALRARLASPPGPETRI